MNSEDFSQKITEKLYLKYQFQPYRSGSKPSLNVINRAQNSINQSLLFPEGSERLYKHHTHFKTLTKNSCTFCTLKLIKTLKREDLRKEDLSISILRFDSNRNIDIERLKKPKRVQKRGKQTF